MREVTSGSNIFRRVKCPGSHHAEAEYAETSSDAADDGKLLHPFAINPKLKRDHLTEKQRMLLSYSDKGRNNFLDAAKSAYGDSDDTEEPPTWKEERLPIIGPDKEPLFTGQADIAWLFGRSRTVALQDFKMGFVEVTRAESNYQLVSYGIAWTDFLHLDKAFVSINQPRSFPSLTTSIYDRKPLELARQEIAAVYHAAMEKDAPRIAGDEQCRFCRAKLECDEYRRKFKPLEIAPDAKSVRTVDNEQLIQLATAVKFASRIEREVMAEMAARIESGEITSWEMASNGETRELTDVVGAFRELSGYFGDVGGFDGEQFTACTSVSWTKLTELFRRLTGFSETRAKHALNELLNPLIERTPKRATPRPLKQS